MKYTKFRGLGNDYLVIQPAGKMEKHEEHQVKGIFHRNYGIGSDGLLFEPLDSVARDFRLGVFNPEKNHPF